MLFPTIEFGIFFLIVFAVSWAVRGWPEARKLFLVGASYFFYGWWDWRFTALLFATTLINFLGGLALGSLRRPGLRKLVVGLTVAEGEEPLPVGAHGIERQGDGKRSIGFVTSSYWSPTLNRPVALALIERGAARHGETIELQHLGMLRRAPIAPPCAFDPAGDRLNA